MNLKCDSDEIQIDKTQNKTEIKTENNSQNIN